MIKTIFPSIEYQYIMTEPSTNDTQLKQIYEQFKFHLIYKSKPKQIQNTPSQQLKNILSEVRRQCRIKKNKKRTIDESINHLHLLQQKSRPLSSVQSRICKSRPIDESRLEEVKEEILIVQKQKQSLQQQINELQYSMSQLKKNVVELKKSVQIQSMKEEKYKHISYLTKSIQRQTDSTKIINYRSFKKLVRYQDEAITNLKKFKTGLRKQNEQLQTRYLQFKERQSNQMKSKTKIDIMQQTNIKYDSSSEFKIDRIFFNKLEQMINLFIEKQPHYEQIKAEHTTKIRLKKINKNYLKQERVKLHDMIDRFEAKHDVKIQSLPNLILYFYKRLNQDNQQMQNECIKHYHIKQVLLEDMRRLKQKEKQMENQKIIPNRQIYTFENAQKRKIYDNSSVFVKFVVLLHNILGKFKYLFTMALTLNIQKKNFQELLSQISNIHKSDSIFYEKDLQDNSVLSLDGNLTNQKQIQSILDQFPQAQQIGKHELLSMIFSDLRYSLMFKRCWLEQQIKDKADSNLLQKISNMQQRCEQVYDYKLKIYIHLLINSLKALNMNKYEKRMIASSNARDSLFLSIPKQKFTSFQENQEISNESNRERKEQDHKFNTQSSEQDIVQFQFTKNPRKIINLLEGIKNQEKQNFKPFIFEPTQVYLYDNKVVLPKYVF